MNGQNPDLNSGTNNIQNNETFGATTLGMAQTIPNTDKTNVSPTSIPNNPQNIPPQVESLDIMPNHSEPVARPIPGTENINLANNINNFTNSNKAENIGVMPPQNDKPVKKKTMNKLLFIILIIILIGAVAYGVYYFLKN